MMCTVGHAWGWKQVLRVTVVISLSALVLFHRAILISSAFSNLGSMLFVRGALAFKPPLYQVPSEIATRTWELSTEAFKSSLNWNADDVLVNLNLGRIHLYQGSYSVAETLLYKAATLSPRNVFAGWALGEAYLAVGEWSRAWDEFDRVGYHPDIYFYPQRRLEARRRMGLWYARGGHFLLQQDRPSAAYEAFRRALNWDERSSLAYEGLVAYYRHQSQWELAANRYRLMAIFGGKSRGALLEGLITLYRKAIDEEPSNIRWHYLLGKHLIEVGQWREGLQEFDSVTRLWKNAPMTDTPLCLMVSDAYYQIGRQAEQDRDLNMTLEAYAQALSLGGTTIAPYLGILRACEVLSAVDGCEDATAMAGELSPEYPTDLVVDDQWTLLGYDLDEVALEKGLNTEMVFYWQPLESKIASGDDLMHVGDYWIQIVETHNLLPNSGLEWDEPGMGRPPYGFQEGIYPPKPENYGITVAQRDNTLTQMMIVENKEANEASGLRSVPIKLIQGRYYLYAGWLMPGETGFGKAGRSWFGTSVPEADRGYHWVPLTAEATAWVHFAEVFTAAYGELRLALINRRWSDHVYFDDLLLVELPIPR